MLKVCRIVEKVAPTNATTLAARRERHGQGAARAGDARAEPAQAKPFVAINCAAIPETLLESELFGFEKGAFTGAVKQTPGQDRGRRRRHAVSRRDRRHAAVAAGEAAAVPAGARSSSASAAAAEIPVDVRVVCATNKNLAARDGRRAFSRRSLLPHQRDHDRDSASARARRRAHRARAAPAAKFAKQQGRNLKGFTDDAQDAIDAYAWPGNVREMENRIKAAVIMAEGKFVTAEDLGLAGSGDAAGAEPAGSCARRPRRARSGRR